MTWYRCMGNGGGGGGGGLTPPTNEWFGTPTEFRALSSKSDDTIYKILFDNIIPSAEFIGSTQISPIGKDFNGYDFLVDHYNPVRYKFDTGFQWFNNVNFEIVFSLGASSYSGTNVIIANSGSPDFNIILNNTSMKIFTTGYNQTTIDTIQANTEYTLRKEGSAITISRGSTQIFTTTNATQNTTTLCLFGWGTSYWMVGPVNYLTVHTITST